jgi:Trypsin-co-occurring domain 1
MSRSISMQSGGVSFLVETDDDVVLPDRYARPRSGPGGPVVNPGVPSGMQPVSGVDRLERQFAEVEQLILTCCNSLYATLARMPQPERVVVEFGVKLGGEVGVPMITKANGEANFRVSVEWKPSRPAPQS